MEGRDIPAFSIFRQQHLPFPFLMPLYSLMAATSCFCLKRKNVTEIQLAVQCIHAYRNRKSLWMAD